MTAPTRTRLPAAASIPNSRASFAWREALTLLAILGLAWFLRARYLADIPRYTDEVNEVQAAIDIAHGKTYPLVSGTKHIGALFDYLLAGAVIGLGRYPDLPRQLALAVGLLTVPAAYGYARYL